MNALRALAVIAWVEGLALLGYAVFDVVEAVRVGIRGPVEVSNPMALTLLVVITAAFGAGMLVVGRGWWRAQHWARSPFLFAQLLVGLIGYELTQAEGSVERTVGMVCVAMAVAGIVLAFTPGVRRAIEDEQPPAGDAP